MNIYFKRVLSLALCVCMTVLAFNLPLKSSAVTESSLKSDINKLQQQAKSLENEIANLKKQGKDQNAVLAAVQKKIANTQAQITRCNNEINSINAKIAKNKKEIDEKNKEIDANKLLFKKRIRAIYMSNSGSQVQILLGADDFADYLQLAQLTASVSSHDKQMIEDIVSAIEVLNGKIAETEVLLKDMVSVRDSIKEQQRQLQVEEAEAEKLYNSIKNKQSSVENDLDDVEASIKDKLDALKSFAQGGSQYSGKINPNTGFMWPVPGHYNVYSPWGNRSGGMHYGIDISDGSIYRAPIVAIADGTVYRLSSDCPHRGRTPRCRCGRGWGNHVGINHGEMVNIDGSVYKAMYAHMDTLAPGIYVGKEVKQGEVIGYVGTTGDSTGYHLHFGLYRNDIWVNPSKYL